MTAAPLAGIAAALGVLALWEALAAAEGVMTSRAVARLLAPVARAGRDGREPTAPELRRLALVGATGLFAAGWLLAGPLAGVVCGAGAPWAVRTLVRQRRRRYSAALERAAPTVARALADALGAGHAVSGAIGEAARGMDGPAAVELTAAVAALRVGQPTEVVLRRLRRRARSRSYDTLVAAILLQREAGGDLATLLRELAAAQEEAQRLLDDARAATAQARFTGLVVAVMPAGAAVLAELGRPGALAAVVQSPLSAWLAGFALLLQAIALVAIRRLARVAA